ncbi:hypothetical protein [Blastomonas aquatica]|uniref:Uncharacterized protein n=1 Tax=Blastomonas aquatica TaxID=1510276 RepID=A0ABQ1IZP5_9SPHN|nr:hypothetical protein [Blastomonas aquatica]GGB55261.1 hypothetical protein GCM10010833_07460 [Blastomonas aquatica]
MRNLDFSSWQNIIITLTLLALITVIGVAVRVLIMMTVQQRRERANRQINERLKTLIAAYRVLGGSFTGDLAVDPRHLRDLQLRSTHEPGQSDAGGIDLSSEAVSGSDRRRRIRDAVEAALSDIILLGTQELVQLAERAANDLVAGRLVHTHDLVVALRNFIRSALDLEPISPGLAIPMQGPTRPSSTGGRGKSDAGDGRGGGGTGGAGGGGGGAGAPSGVSGAPEQPLP